MASAGDDDPNGGPPDGTVEGTIPGTPGGGDEDGPADALGCPAVGPPVWNQATQAQVEAARAAGQLDQDDLDNEALMGMANLWSYCDTNQGWRLWDYREQEGTPMIPFEDLIAKPDPQLHPGNQQVVVDFPVWLTLQNGGVQVLDAPAGAGQFRAVPEMVIWKTGVGNESVTCMDLTNGHKKDADLDPPTGPRSRPPANACLHSYDRPSTADNAGEERAFEMIVEMTYRIETRPNGSNGPWTLYGFDPVAIQTSAPELVRGRRAAGRRRLTVA